MSRVKKLSESSLPTEPSVIFVDTTEMPSFLRNIVPHMQAPFVLVSGDSDESNPGSVTDQLDAFMNNPLLLHWYGMNCDSHKPSTKFSCIAMGLSQWSHQRDAMQKLYEEGKGLKNGVHLRERIDGTPIEVLCSFNSAYAGRDVPHRICCDPSSPISQVSKCYYTALHVANIESVMPELYQDVARSKFVFSPSGVGLDCYRTWEALYLGAFPVVLTSSLDELYENLPVLIVKDWNEVTLELLSKTYQALRSRDNYSFSKLYNGYSYRKFRTHFGKCAEQ